MLEHPRRYIVVERGQDHNVTLRTAEGKVKLRPEDVRWLMHTALPAVAHIDLVPVGERGGK